MSKIYRNNFVNQHQNKSVDLDKLKDNDAAKAKLEDAGVSVADLERADRNNDGQLSAREAFWAADHFDNDGNRGSLINANAAGTTRAGQALEGLSEALQDASLQRDPAANSKASRGAFTSAHAGEKVNVFSLQADAIAKAKLEEAGVSMDEVVAADRNKDGQLSATEAFRLADKFDNDGNAATLKERVNGETTKAGATLEALGEILSASGNKPSPQDIVNVANFRIDKFGENYGVDGQWHSPNPGIPGNRNPDEGPVGRTGAEGRWKCNLFGLDTLYQAGYDVPTYGSNGQGWYPIAVDIPRFAQGPNRHFDRIEGFELNGLTKEQKEAKLEDLMRQAQPGDIIIADHQGPASSDGGHTRIVIANNFDTDGTIQTAEARHDSAQLMNHDATSLGRIQFDGSAEEKMFLLRPIRFRNN